MKQNKDIEELQKIKRMGKQIGPKHKRVRMMWDIIRNKGDHMHNLRVLSEGIGEIILGRRQHGLFDVKQYGPCPKCFIWIKIDKTMFRHQLRCPSTDDGDDHLGMKELRITSLAEAGRLNLKAEKALREEVFTTITNDHIGQVAQNDTLIIALGNLWLTKNIGNKLKRKYYTFSRMRDSARLLINLREQTGHEDYDMSEFLEPDKFDHVVTAALTTASPGFDDEEDLKSPSTAIKLGYDIKRMVGAYNV